jgi:hypothetical protein
VSGGGSATAMGSDPTTILSAFTDVSPSDSFLPAIDLLKEYDITHACQDLPPKYCPNDNITEAQMAVFVVRSVMGGDNFTYTQTPYFSDVLASNLYFPWVQKMQDLGIALSLRVEPVLSGHPGDPRGHGGPDHSRPVRSCHSIQPRHALFHGCRTEPPVLSVDSEDETIRDHLGLYRDYLLP